MLRAPAIRARRREGSARRPAVAAGEGDRGRRRGAALLVLHFPEHPPVLDTRGTVFSDGRVVKPAIDVAAARPYRVFGSPVATPVDFVVARAVRDAVRRAGCRGIRFTPVA